MGIVFVKDCCCKADPSEEYTYTNESQNLSLAYYSYPQAEINYNTSLPIKIKTSTDNNDSQINVKDIPSESSNNHKHLIPNQTISNEEQSNNKIPNHECSPLDFYEKISLIGEGAIGKVYKVKKKNTNIIRAMKVIPIEQVKDYFTQEQIENEIQIFKAMSHSNIIKLYEVYYDDENYSFISDYCSDGDLCQLLLQIKRLEECIVQKLMYQLFSAVTYLHEQRIIHGDLKLENIMIDKTIHDNNSTIFIESLKLDIAEYQKNPQWAFDNIMKYTTKLIDFGCSRLFGSKNNITDGNIGTLFYSSPEMFSNNYNDKTDIWSCGVIMYMLLAGEIPFKGANEKEIKESIIQGQFCFYNRCFKNISYKAKDLIQKCLTYNPSDRMTAKDALNHPYFNYTIPPIIQTNKNEIFSSLITPSNKTRFFHGILAYLIHQFVTKNDIMKMKGIFLAIDSDFDGMISIEELNEGFKAVKHELSQEKLEEIMNRIDLNKDGSINEEEFLQATLELDYLFTEKNLQKAFEMFNKSQNSPLIINDELKSLLGMINTTNEEIILQLLKEINKSINDEFSFEEFKTIMLDCLHDQSQQSSYIESITKLIT